MLRNVTFGEVDSTDEIVKEMNKIIDAVNDNTRKIELSKAKKKAKKKGSVFTRTLLSLVILAVIAGLCYAYVPTDINYDIASNPDLLATYLRDSFGNITSNSYLFTPTTTSPSHSEGKVYYDNTLNKLQLSTGTDWLPIDTAGGVSLDSAYDYGSAGGGKAITVSDGAVALTAPNADNNTVLQLVQSDTATALGLDLNNAGSGNSIDIEGTSGNDIQGTGDTWEISTAGLITTSGGFTIESGGDSLFDDTYDISWDSSRDQLLFEDNAVLGIGGAHDAAGDVTLMWNASNLLVESAAEDTGEWQFGATNAIDVVHYANTNTSEAMFNASTATLEFNGYDVQVMDDDIVAYGDSDEFSSYYDEASTDNLIIVAANANDKVQIGDGTTGTDFRMMGATSGDYAEFDASADEMYHEDCDLKLNEGAQIEFCASDNATDWTIDSATAERLTLTPSETDDTSVLHIGTAANTSDLVIFMKTAGETLTMDASADSLTFVGDLALFTLTGTTLPFHANVTGTVAGEAAKLETTNGGITLLADGAANGDILIDAEDNITIVSTDADAAGIHIHANGGASETIVINANQGTGVDSITIDSDDGGITINTGTGANDGITYNGRTDSLIVIEGTANGFETSLTFTDPSADGVINFPDTADEGAAGGDIVWIADAGTTTKDATDAALPLTDAIVIGTSDADSEWSLANGEHGQILTVVIGTDGGEAVITPATSTGWATAVLTDDIDGITMMYIDDTVGWIVLGTSSDGTNIVAITQ